MKKSPRLYFLGDFGKIGTALVNGLALAVSILVLLYVLHS
jgi:hypothetical protein